MLFYRDHRRRVHLMTVLEAEARYERALIHEAGHVVVGLALGCRIERVHVSPREARTTAHHVREDGPPLAAWEVERAAACNLGGYFAERRRFPAERGWARRCASTDFERTMALLPPGSAAWRRSARLAKRTLVRHWPVVAAVADRVRETSEVRERELVMLAEAHGLTFTLR